MFFPSLSVNWLHPFLISDYYFLFFFCFAALPTHPIWFYCSISFFFFFGRLVWSDSTRLWIDDYNSSSDLNLIPTVVCDLIGIHGGFFLLFSFISSFLSPNMGRKWRSGFLFPSFHFLLVLSKNGPAHTALTWKYCTVYIHDSR
ncbi:uncharacterized protein BO66DRAFT_235490 [Aspergillus aculeatinus CBS 121060]|uniref:Uncharacterized protein n=1 Tax=Aspergillus aculeatinus CBS 121060 TaxID=1448322 RepID=A0ACD1HI85_9EURO|nr:hypothetical protein BO66DRAFT_235490 [Aspergillus aculeatinus CBS 121060]RAH73120.1 hypothetical protein BO66DRAFT_235490 [Aspergillus aculeatinus CBS 121060]